METNVTLALIRAQLVARTKKEPSDLGVKVAYILSRFTTGLHNVERVQKTDWSQESYIEYLQYGGLANVDANKLTTLVVLCHDAKIRVSIEACNMHYLRLLFHQRKNRDGALHERCPHIEEAIALIRRGGDMGEGGARA
ncbi:hypothetical protein EON81_07925 [bacterium]|nr:MAG: hypothetical protein EON81_07925 [bacterium]